MGEAYWLTPTPRSSPGVGWGSILAHGGGGGGGYTLDFTGCGHIYITSLGDGGRGGGVYSKFRSCGVRVEVDVLGFPS